MSVIVLFGLLQLKHFIIDWWLQPPYMWQNKGSYGHPGGILHAGFNALGTAACFLFFTSIGLTVIVAAVDFLLHYHIDWAKMNINKTRGWDPTTHSEFWVLTGFDQLLHQLTYIGLIAMVTP